MDKYWQKRAEQRLEAAEKGLKEYYKGLIRAFEQVKREINAVIYDFYLKYAQNNKISLVEAQNYLNFNELKEFKGDLQEFIRFAKENIGRVNIELENLSIKARITRYQALEAQINEILEKLYAIDYEKYGSEKLKDIYQDQYHRTLFDIGQYRGFNQAVAQLNTNIIDELIKYPFNGLNFSDRIWRQKGDLIYKLREAMTTSFIQGKNPKELAESFAKVFQTKEYEAYRLLHTETTFMAEQATLQAYRDDEIEQYEFVATLDMRTSDICQEHDGKIYDVDKATVGVNCPPLHPFCRSTTVPYFGEKEGTRAARGADGKTYYVPANMTYEQWYKGYVVNKNNSGIINTGAISGALNPYSKEANKHAVQYYDSVRRMKSDSIKIADNTGYKPENILKIKEHIFIKRHDLGLGVKERFAPDYEIAQSWQRLIDGKNIKEQDYILLKHEFLELKLMEKGYLQQEAHLKASKKYNYSKALEKGKS
ncbi:MAG: minor capsid protein [Clostridia bacterium]|nr:minor capsid protein [Clostridia bacterium]